jgi:hypothetical protein
MFSRGQAGKKGNFPAMQIFPLALLPGLVRPRYSWVACCNTNSADAHIGGLCGGVVGRLLVGLLRVSFSLISLLEVD